jgi:taurine--2-oxoglutarate transaminase
VEGVDGVDHPLGVLVGSGRPDIQNIISPPLCIDEADLKHGVSVLDDAIEATFD